MRGRGPFIDMTYIEKLRDPRWQKRRLEILSRDNFICCVCKGGERTLHVHHLFYVTGRDPWNYPNFSLVTLCDECHRMEQDFHSDVPYSFESFLDVILTGIPIENGERLNLLTKAALNKKKESKRRKK